MRHPFRETADLLRDLIRLHKRQMGKWWDERYVARLRSEALKLEHLASIDYEDR